VQLFNDKTNSYLLLFNPERADKPITMKPQVISRALHLLPALLSLVNAAPARRDGSSGSNPGLRGSEALVGYSATEQVASGSKPDIKYTLLPGQKEDPKIGSYLDFENVENPQPIRGTTGSDDPGPRKFIEGPLCKINYLTGAF
jgi:hypothetical protein